jgi:hypothetical protein
MPMVENTPSQQEEEKYSEINLTPQLDENPPKPRVEIVERKPPLNTSLDDALPQIASP